MPETLEQHDNQLSLPRKHVWTPYAEYQNTANTEPINTRVLGYLLSRFDVGNPDNDLMSATYFDARSIGLQWITVAGNQLEFTFDCEYNGTQHNSPEALAAIGMLAIVFRNRMQQLHRRYQVTYEQNDPCYSVLARRKIGPRKIEAELQAVQALIVESKAQVEQWFGIKQPRKK